MLANEGKLAMKDPEERYKNEVFCLIRTVMELASKRFNSEQMSVLNKSEPSINELLDIVNIIPYLMS